MYGICTCVVYYIVYARVCVSMYVCTFICICVAITVTSLALGRIYVLNAPSVFGYVYAMVKPWLDPVVAAKIFVCRGPEEYVPILIDFIGKENLPANYGGDLPPLNVDVHPYAYAYNVFQYVYFCCAKSKG
ncbi:hypothetical protein EON63_21110 [archaeon]|nr:MAG: hypothetical protein EON63_21110 [archaeon]